MKEYILEVKNLTKKYGGQTVLDHLDLKIEKGKIYGLVGANGSGKSTLMNILYGSQVIQNSGGYDGTVLLEGESVKLYSASEAIRRGIGMIHQEFILIPDMTVSENIYLTREHTGKFLHNIWNGAFSKIDQDKNKTCAKNVLNRLGFHIDSSIFIRHLSVNAKQFVEIAREVSKSDLKLLLLDEPTAVLNEEDSRKLLSIVKELSDQGISILFSSHRLHEIVEICDEILVIRDGKTISLHKKGAVTESMLAKDMIGHDVDRIVKKRNEASSKELLEFNDFSVTLSGEPLHHFNFAVKEGEVLGITSLSGHGKLALGYGLMGLASATGRVSMKGKELDVSRMDLTIQNGVFMLPDDRKHMGLLMEHTVEDNIIFTNMVHKEAFQKRQFGFLMKDRKKVKLYVEDTIEKLDIKCTSRHQHVSALSGGNQQKVCIARAAALNPEVLCVMEPTRGVDIGAKEKIMELLLTMNRESGTTLMIVSSELEELKRMCDRILILCEGKISAVLPPDASEETFGLALSGEVPDET